MQDISIASPVQGKIRWGILSTARINRSLIGPLRSSPRSDLVAVASRNLEDARSYAEKNQISKAYGSYQELLDDPEIDAVYISLPNHLHCEWTVAAAKSGKHVLCEKPLVLKSDEMDRVEAATRDNGVVIFEAFMYLHHPQTLRLLRMVRSGELGQLHSVRSHFSYFLAPDSGNVRLQSDMGGGSLWDVGVYPVSLSVLMADAGPPVQVFGTRRNGETGIDVGFEGLLRFSNGIVAQISCGFDSPLEWGATLAGSESIVRIDEPWKPGFEGAVSSVTTQNHQGDRETVTFSEPDPYLCEIAAMEACILDGADPVVPLTLSKAILTTVLALYRSADTGQPVTLKTG
jgi:predicted dehydrogenase